MKKNLIFTVLLLFLFNISASAEDSATGGNDNQFDLCLYACGNETVTSCRAGRGVQLSDEALAIQRGRGLENESFPQSTNLAIKNETRASANRSAEIEGTAINNAELGDITGGALGYSLPDVKNTKVSVIILWDEVKTKQSVPVNQVSSGQFRATISDLRR